MYSRSAASWLLARSSWTSSLTGRELVIQAQLKPTDADDAYPGQKGQIRFVSIHNRALPLFSGYGTDRLCRQLHR